MTTFIGEHTAKVDIKGRMVFPSSFKKQNQTTDADRYVLKRDIYEECLVLYTMEEWQTQTELIRSKINPFNKKHARFLRGFFRGTAEITLDNNSRMLIPKSLLEAAKIEKEVYLAGVDSKIEIWSKELYEALDDEMDDFAELAADILGTQEEEE